MLQDDLIEKLLEIVCNGNETLRMMFSLKAPPPKHKTSRFKKTFWSRSTIDSENGSATESRLLNYYGLLEGHLLSGDGIARIAAGILKKFLLIRYNRDPKSFCRILRLSPAMFQDNPQRSNEIMEDISTHINFQDYYLLTDRIELTCTSVDLDDSIIRCLNHKTTPFLPVCKAVQMTASYPIAFEAIRWRKEWGKYYIHYANTRKEIDLTGHQFTDGGLLSNFPIKFLDNESVRPMYFSHMSTKMTRVFGFGLEQITQDEMDETIEAGRKGGDELIKLIKKKFPLLRILYEQLVHTPRPQFIPVASMTTLYDIPITKFITTLIRVLYDSTDNFVRECFRKDIYLMEATTGIGKFVMTSTDQQLTIKKHTELRDSFANLSMEMQASIYHNNHFIEYVKCRAQPLLTQPKLQDLIQVRSLLLISLKSYSLYSIKVKKEKYGKKSSVQEQALDKAIEEVDVFMADLLSRTEDINRHHIFRSDCLRKDVEDLFDVIKRWESQLKLTNVRNEAVRVILATNFQGLFEYMRYNAIAEIDTLSEELDRRLRIENSQEASGRVHDNKLAEKLSNFSESFPLKALPGYTRFMQCMENLDEYILTQTQKFQRSRTSVYEYIERMVSNGNSSNIHLVLESSGGLTAKYFMDVYRLVNEYLFTNETKKTAYLIDKIADAVLRENFRRDPTYHFGITDLVKFIIVHSDIHKYVSSNYEQLGSEIVFDYGKFTISPQLQQRVREMVARHRKNVTRITSITCSSTQCYLAFLFTLGLDNTQIFKEVDQARKLLEINYAKANREFYDMEWAIPFKCKIREFNETMWESRYDFFEEVQAKMKDGQLQVDLDRLKRQFQEEKERILDSFHLLMDYVVEEEIKARQTRSKTFEEYLADKLSVKYGGKNYRKINEKIGKDTKKALQLIYFHFQALIRHLIYTYSQNENLEFLMFQKDLLNREAIWKGLIMTNLINVRKIKQRIQDLLAQFNLPRDIRLKEYKEYAPVKIELTFVALDIISHCIEFINHNTYPHMPLWAAILTGSAYSPLFSPLRTKPSWSQRIDSNNELRHLNSFFNGDSWWNLPVFVSGSTLVRLPLEYLTNPKIREVYYAGIPYTFLSFGVRSKRNARPVIEPLFYRRFLTIRDTFKLALHMQGIHAAFSSKAQTNVLVSQLLNEDNLTFQIYHKELLRLPVQLGTLEFVKIKEEGVIPAILEESYYHTIEKFCTKKRTCIRAVVRKEKLFLRFISKERNNKDLHRKYKIFYRLQGQEQEELQKEQLNVPKYMQMDSLELEFRYIDRTDLGGRLGRYSVYERRFRIDLVPFRYFSAYEGLYSFPYNSIINGAVNPLKPPTFTMKPEFEGSTITYAFICKSIVDVGQTGLYCEDCTSALSLDKQGQMRLTIFSCMACAKCGDKRNPRFICRNFYGDCAARYCIKCCKSQIIFRSKDNIYCAQGHEFTFRKQTAYLLKSEEVNNSKCDLCHAFTNSYFFDENCEITLCHSCSAELPVHELTH